MVDLAPFRYEESDYSVRVAIEKYNLHLLSLSQEYSNVKLIDFKEFTEKYSINQLLDWRFYFISQMGMNPKLAPDFSTWLQGCMKAIQLQRKNV